MCGFFVTSRRTNPSESRVAAAIEAIKHRGTRLTVKEAWGSVYAHARLPIVGLSADNDQPVEHDPWLIGFVGEVLDFRDEDHGVDCDLQVVVDAWVDRGPYGLNRRDGFWSICAVHKDGMIRVVCDYLAQKPTYYRTDVPSACSEIKPLTKLADVTLDEVYLAAVAKWGYCPDVARTPYQEIKHVLPGECVSISYNGNVHRAIVDPLVPIRGGVSLYLKDEVEMAAARRATASDVPVACLLSGGLDSAITYTLAQRHADVRAYTVVVDGDELDVVDRLTSSSHVVSCDSVTINKALEVMQEPIDLGSLRPQVALSHVVHENVCLTGDGADEAFGGYGRASRYDSQGSDLFHELPAWHLPRLDRVMMRDQIEVRSPFLARRVLQIALGLPWELRRDKKILRDLFRDDLPTGVADQPKKPLRVSGVDESYRLNLIDDFKRNYSEWNKN